MARQSELDRVKKWKDRLKSANKMYDAWSDSYNTKLLEKYYTGQQWRGEAEDDAKDKYVINLIFATIEVSKPSMVFYRPQLRVQPRPSRMSNAVDPTADTRARLCEDTIQTYIDDPDINFATETSLALHEAHFRFGVIEVGYSADYIDNPNADKPILKEKSEEPLRDSKGKEVLEPGRIVEREELYVRRIPASAFRVSLSSKNSLIRNDWVGYYEWHYLADIKRNPEYKNTANLKPSGRITDDFQEGRAEDDLDIDRRSDMVKIWKVWDIRTGNRHVIAESHDKFLQEDEEFKFLPFAVMKFHDILDSFYPLPPVSQWLGPQDEINETREGQRAHRRRFYRRYQYRENSVEQTELDKFETGGDGVMVAVKVDGAIQPIQDAPLSSDQWRGLDESKSDLLTVSSIGGDQRGVAESATATQATIIDTRARLREASSRTRVADWLAYIGRLILLTVRQRMSLPIWIKRNANLHLATPEDIQKLATMWQLINADDLGDIDLDIFVDLASMTPITEDAQRNSWNQILGLLTNQSLIVILSQSEVLLRKTLSLYGIRSENEIQEIKRVIEGLAAVMAQAAGTEAGVASAEAGGGAEGAQPGTEPQPEGGTPPNETIMKQLDSIGGGQSQPM